jgi:hypothetical protein
LSISEEQEELEEDGEEELPFRVRRLGVEAGDDKCDGRNEGLGAEEASSSSDPSVLMVSFSFILSRDGCAETEDMPLLCMMLLLPESDGRMNIDVLPVNGKFTTYFVSLPVVAIYSTAVVCGSPTIKTKGMESWRLSLTVATMPRFFYSQSGACAFA